MKMGEEFRIMVTAKQVPDPEGPSSSFVVDEAGLRVKPEGIPPVVNPYDENALEVALLFKEAHGARITLVSLGHRLAPAVFLKALATGADELLALDDPAFDRETLDSHASAFWLAAAVRRAGLPDLILAGRQASDTNAGQVAAGLAQMLDIPAVTMARKVDLENGRLRVERVLPNGFEVVYVQTPALVIVSHEAGELRYPALAAIKASKALPQTRWSKEDMGLEPPPVLCPIVALRRPVHDRECRLVEGESGAETGELLAELLLAEKVF